MMNKKRVLEFKAINLSDVLEVSLLEYTIWRDTYENILPLEYLNSLDTEHIQQKFIDRLQHQDIESYLIKMNGFNVGYFVLTYYIDKIELSKIYLLREYQHLGIGTHTLSFIYNRAIQRNINVIQSWIVENNVNSILFHQKMGFVPTFDEKLLSVHKVRAYKYVKTLTNTDNPTK